jgi:hypothetical protein
MEFIGDLNCASCHKSLRETGIPHSNADFGDFVHCSNCLSWYTVQYEIDPETANSVAYLTPVKVTQYNEVSSEGLKDKIRNSSSVSSFLQSLKEQK